MFTSFYSFSSSTSLLVIGLYFVTCFSFYLLFFSKSFNFCVRNKFAFTSVQFHRQNLSKILKSNNPVVILYLSPGVKMSKN